MKIALISDIHANLPALEAVLQDIDGRNPDMIFCLGDLVGYAPWPNEVIDLIRSRRIPTIAGNYDEGIGLHSDECGCAYKTDEEKAMGKISIRLTNEWTTEDRRLYLRRLPAHIALDFQFGTEKIKLLLVHGSPRKINEYLFEDREDKSLLRIMKEEGADIMAFGHTHKPWHRAMSDGEQFVHAVNTGSVGKPKDGDPRAGYVMLHLDEKSSLKNAAGIRVEFIRVGYDVGKTAQAIEQSGLPVEYAGMLRKAY
ncbi:MAG: metallophosphoesterase [Bacteroidetes bacterium]|nr:MAG: metallophosphoesterase [Bacteroidota bacterium]